MRVKPWSGHSRKTLAAALHLHLHLLLLLRSGFHQNLCSSCYRTCYRPCFMCTRPVWGCEVPACAGIVFLSRLFVLLSARGVVPVFAGDGHTCSASPSTSVFKAPASCRLTCRVVPGQTGCFPCFLDCFHECFFFLFPRSSHSPREKSLSSGSWTLHSGARLQRSGLRSPLCVPSFKGLFLDF